MSTTNTESVQVVSGKVELYVLQSNVQGYKARVIQLKPTPSQNEALYRLAHGLMIKQARLENNRPITTTGHAMQWLLEQVAKQFPESTQPAAAKKIEPQKISDLDL